MLCQIGQHECDGCGDCKPDTTVFNCTGCGESVHAGEDYYDVAGSKYCTDCVTEEVAESDDDEPLVMPELLEIGNIAGDLFNQLNQMIRNGA